MRYATEKINPNKNSINTAEAEIEELSSIRDIKEYLKKMIRGKNV